MKRGLSPVITLVLILSFIVIAAFGVYFIFFRGDSNSADLESSTDNLSDQVVVPNSAKDKDIGLSDESTVINNSITELPKCSDGTFYGECSFTKSKYCDNGNLLTNVKLCGCPLGLKFVDDECLDVIEVISSDEKVILEFDFEGESTLWTTDAWDSSKSNFVWENNFGHSGSGSLSISSDSPNDARWRYELETEPEKSYRLSGYIKGENVVNHDDGGLGVRLETSVGATEDVSGTFDWKKFESISTGAEDDFIWCRLGGYGDLVTGKAWFDDVTLSVDPLTKYEGENVYIFLENDDLESVSSDVVKQWVINLDEAYETYYSLVGVKPFNGNKVGVMSVLQYPGGWAVAGNPIQWHQIYVEEELKKISETGDWSFGIMHEMGHDFDIAGEDRWNWDSEFFANFKMFYVAETLNATIVEGNTYFGSELRNYYRIDSGDGYEKTLEKGIYKGDGLLYKLILIKDEIGWEPFKKTFGFFVDLSGDEVPVTGLEKFNLFIDKLSEFSGEDVKGMFSLLEWNAIIDELD